MTLFKPVFLDQRISLKPSEFADAAADIDAYLVKKISKDLDGMCCVHGYVKPGSTQILARSMGQAEHGRFTADFLFNCKIRFMCFLPHADQILEGRVLKVNKFGAYALIVDAGRVSEAMRILLPRDYHLNNAEFDSIEVGTGIRIRLMKSTFQAKDDYIRALGLFEGFSASASASAPDVLLTPALPATEGDAAVS
jgi:DNA-directed RNA polymerase subunit E'/Rpb7